MSKINLFKIEGFNRNLIQNASSSPTSPTRLPNRPDSEMERNGALEFLRRSFSPPNSPLSVCFTSRSSAGAWQIRGQQIAAMRSNWTAFNQPTDEELALADLVCLVKKPDLGIIQRVRQLGKPIVFDIVDSWAQPEDGLKHTDLSKARELFAPTWRCIGADGYIFPTRRMQEDLGQLVPERLTIYHHYWPQIKKNPVREQVAVIGYEGGDYLGEWRSRIEKACLDRGIRFVVNPTNYTELDIVILVRGGPHGSFLSQQYKSNVKLANAMGSGTPALVHFDEMSAHDTDTGDVLFFTDRPGSFERQLDLLIGDYALRMHIHQKFLNAAPKFHINNIADQFEGFFLKILEMKRGKDA